MSLVKHKKAHLDYEILERFEAGLQLLGFETKALRAGHAKLEGARVIVRGGEAFVIGVHISPYQLGNTPESYAPDRTRKLLLSKKEIRYLATKAEAAGMSIIPLAVFPKGKYLKLEVALVRGKKKYDKRETIKKRDVERSMRRDISY